MTGRQAPRMPNVVRPRLQGTAGAAKRGTRTIELWQEETPAGKPASRANSRASHAPDNPDLCKRGGVSAVWVRASEAARSAS